MTERSARYELKLTFETARVDQVRSWITLHPAAFVSAYPPRRVNTLYFDTPDLDSYNDHLAGVPERRKLRFRWYGESLRRARGHMEIKVKSERSGWKILQPVETEFDLERMDWFEILNGLREGTTGIVAELLWLAHPTVVSVYDREYYVSSDGEVRLTLDTDLLAYDQLFTARPNISFRQPIEEKVVLELKSDTANASLLADVLASLPGRAERYSKYADHVGLSLVK